MTFRTLHLTRTRRMPFPGRREGAEAALSRLRQAMGTLAHDLRNPLNSILLMAQLLEETGGSPEAVRIAMRIQRQCHEMDGMLNTVMEIVGQ